jgi:DNA-binding phage protein
METNRQVERINRKVDALIKKRVILQKDIENLTNEENRYLNIRLCELFNTLKGEEKDKFLKKIEHITNTDFNNDLWETNHKRIMAAINNVMAETGVMPGKAQIAKESGLSRQTIHKHLKEYQEHHLYREQEGQFRFLKARMQAILYQLAAKGDAKAIKLFLEVTGLLDNSKTVNKNVIENQHNYIQINETRLSQEEIKKLSPKRLKQIEALLKIPERP